jgi:hypothetical protein
MISLVVACTPGLAARKPLDQQPIGTGVPGGPSATLPTTAAAPSSFDAAPLPSMTSEAGAPSTASSGAATGAPSTIAPLCPPKGQKPDLSRFAAKSGCKAPKPRSKQLAELRSNEQLLASMQANAPEREELVFRLAQGYAILECTLAAACAKSRDASATPDEISLADLKQKTDEYCATIRSDFPKSKRHCP